MAETWNVDNPKTSNQVQPDVLDIEENFDYLIHRFGYRVSNSGDQDQGAAGSTAHPTIKDIADAKTTDYFIIFFPHTQKDGATTKYSLDTSLDLSAKTNLYLWFQPGAYLDQVTSDEVLTLPSPANIIALDDQKIFDGDIIDFNAGGKVKAGWWGPDGTGDEVEIGYAFNSLPSGNGVVQLQRKQYSTAATITVPTNGTLRGMGPKHSNIAPAASSFNAVTFTASGSDMTIENLGITGTDPAADNTERGIYGDTVTDCIIQNCFIEKGNYCIQIQTPVRLKIINNEFFDTARNTTQGTAVQLNTDPDHCIITNNTFKTIASIAIYLSTGSSYCVVADNVIDGCMGGIELYSLTTDNTCVRNIITNNTIDSSAGANGDGIAVSENCRYTVISNNVIFNNSRYGIWLEGNNANTDKPAYNTIIGNIIHASGNVAIRLLNTDDNVIANNVVNNTTANHGIQVAISGSDVGSYSYRNLIEGNLVQYANGTGVQISDSDCQETRVLNNMISNCGTNLTDSGTNTRISGNYGYVSENGGITGAITTGTAVNHGLATTPECVIATAAETGPTDVYVDTVGATSFKINFGGGGTKTFYWRAMLPQSK